MTYQGPDRRHGDSDLESVRVELAQVKAAVITATTDLISQDSLNRTARMAARRLGASMVVAVLVIAVLGSIQISAVRGVRDVAHRTEDVTRRIEDCTIAGGDCYQQLAKNGQAGVARLIDYFNCALLIVPEDRTASKLGACKERAITVPAVPAGGATPNPPK